ncbi:MAG: FtsX-like permease family protein [Elusimicrobiota bacterium]
MLWLKLGWRNLWRSPRRTAIELASIAGAVFLCMFMVCMQAGMYPKMIEEGTRMGSGHVGFYRKGYLDLRQVSLSFPVTELIAKLDKNPEVSGVYARVLLPGLARSSHDSRGGVMMGVDFPREAEINPLLKDKRIVEGRLPEEDKLWEAVMGAELANELGLKLGRKFVWMAQDHKGEMVSRLFRVRGLLDTGIPDIDKGAVLVHRRAAARLLGAEDRAHELAVLLSDYRQAERFLPKAEELASGLAGVEALPWQEAMPQIADAIRLDRTSGYIFFGLILVLVGLGTANTMLMSVMERVREFGVVRALGLGGPGIVSMVFAEGVVLGVFGAVVGILLWIPLGLYGMTHGIDFSGLMSGEGQEFGGVLIEPILKTGWDWPKTAVVTLIVAALALVASIYPTCRALRVRPADAMRRY